MSSRALGESIQPTIVQYLDSVTSKVALNLYINLRLSVYYYDTGCGARTCVTGPPNLYDEDLDNLQFSPEELYGVTITDGAERPMQSENILKIALAERKLDCTYEI